MLRKIIWTESRLRIILPFFIFLELCEVHDDRSKFVLLSVLQERMDIKKDKKGLVFVQGSVVKEAQNSKELFALFEEGSKNRHTASTSKTTSI